MVISIDRQHVINRKSDKMFDKKYDKINAKSMKSMKSVSTNNLKDKIHVGEVYDNYAELCRKLKENIKSGKSKMLQLEKWSEKFLWEKQGNKFIITEVFNCNEEKKKEITLSKIIELVTFDMLINYKDEENFVMLTTKNNLAQSLGLVNQNFINFLYSKKVYLAKRIIALAKGEKLKYSKNKFVVPMDKREEIVELIKEDDLELVEKLIEEAFKRIYNSYYKRVNNLLITLSDKKLIGYNRNKFVKTINRAEKVEFEFIRDEFGEKKGIKPKLDFLIEKAREATNEEIIEILKVERETLDQLGLEDIQKVIISGKIKEYNSLREQKLLKKEIIAAYDLYAIIFPKDGLIEQKKKYLRELKKEYNIKEDSAWQKSVLTNLFKEKIKRNKINKIKRDNLMYSENKMTAEQEKEIKIYNLIVDLFTDKFN